MTSPWFVSITEVHCIARPDSRGHLVFSGGQQDRPPNAQYGSLLCKGLRRIALHALRTNIGEDPARCGRRVLHARSRNPKIRKRARCKRTGDDLFPVAEGTHAQRSQGPKEQERERNEWRTEIVGERRTRPGRQARRQTHVCAHVGRCSTSYSAIFNQSFFCSFAHFYSNDVVVLLLLCSFRMPDFLSSHCQIFVARFRETTHLLVCGVVLSSSLSLISVS